MRRALPLMLRVGALGAALAVANAPAFAQQAAPASPAIDPARVALARPVVDRLFPVGTYKRIMGTTMGKLMDTVMDSTMNMPMASLARIGGVPSDQLAKMDKATLAEIMAILDPYYRERTKRGMNAMMGSMTDLMIGFEPQVRDALTRVYARRFDAKQLGELKLFFDTPTGSAYAADSMTLMMEPEIMGEMQAFMPQMMAKMPDFVAAAEKAVAELPKPKRYADLSKPEREKLAKLLGVDASELHDNDPATSMEAKTK
jgi:hypothetical protein